MKKRPDHAKKPTPPLAPPPRVRRLEDRALEHATGGANLVEYILLVGP